MLKVVRSLEEEKGTDQPELWRRRRERELTEAKRKNALETSDLKGE